MLLGYHLLWSTTANVVGSPEQADRLQQLIITNNYFVGGAVNPRDNDLNIVESADGTSLVFKGFKNFSTGGVVSDLTVLEGAYNGTEAHIFAVVPSNQPGIQPQHNWDNIGLKLTESGAIKIDEVVVPWEDALGWDVAQKQPDPKWLGIHFGSLLLPTYVEISIDHNPQYFSLLTRSRQDTTCICQLLPRNRPGRASVRVTIHHEEHQGVALWRRCELCTRHFSLVQQSNSTL